MEQFQPQTSESVSLTEINQRLTNIEAKVNQIHEILHPPIWKSLPKWIIRHIIPITLFVISAIALYQGYQLFIELREQLLPLLEAKDNLTNIDEELIKTLENFKLPF